MSNNNTTNSANADNNSGGSSSVTGKLIVDDPFAKLKERQLYLDAFHALNRRDVNLSLSSKRAHLEVFLTMRAHGSIFDNDDANMMYAELLRRLRYTGKNKSSREKSWRITPTAEFLSLIYALQVDVADASVRLDRASKNISEEEKSTKTAFSNITMFIKEAIENFKSAQLKKRPGSDVQRIIGFSTQKTGTKHQDDIPFNIDEQCTEPCPSCSHLCTMPLESKKTMEEINKNLLDDYKKKRTRMETEMQYHHKWATSSKATKTFSKMPYNWLLLFRNALSFTCRWWFLCTMSRNRTNHYHQSTRKTGLFM